MHRHTGIVYLSFMAETMRRKRHVQGFLNVWGLNNLA